YRQHIFRKCDGRRISRKRERPHQGCRAEYFDHSDLHSRFDTDFRAASNRKHSCFHRQYLSPELTHSPSDSHRKKQFDIPRGAAAMIVLYSYADGQAMSTKITEQAPAARQPQSDSKTNPDPAPIVKDTNLRFAGPAQTAAGIPAIVSTLKHLSKEPG